jgi:PAS domain S-box-containing protein
MPRAVFRSGVSVHNVTTATPSGDTLDEGVPPRSLHRARKSALWVSLTYAAFATLWILFSDRALEVMVADPTTQMQLQTVKGWFFVAMTAALLYLMISRTGRRRDAVISDKNVALPSGDPGVQRMITLAIVTLIAVILINLAYTLWEDRRETLAEAATQSVNLAQVLDEQTRGIFNAVELTLLSSERDMRLLAIAGKPPAAVHEMLREQLKTLPYVRALFVVDAGGRMIHDSDSFPAASFNFGDRPYFAMQRDGKIKGLYIGPPVKSRTNSLWFISVSRRLTAADGSFAGVIVAAVEPLAIKRFYDKINVGRDGAVALRLESGQFLARSPLLEPALGRTYSNRGSNGEPIEPKAIETRERVSAIDGVDRISTCRHISERGLVVCIGVAKNELLKRWWSEVWTYVLISLVFILIVAWLGAVTLTELRRRDGLIAEIRDSEERFRQVSETSNDAVLIVDANRRIRYANRAARRVFGYEPADLIDMPLSRLQPERFSRPREEITPADEATVERKLNWQSTETFGVRSDGSEFPLEI